VLVLAHFNKYPLLTQKGADFKLFKQIVEKKILKEHLKQEGLEEIVNLKASMNFLVLPDKLLSFPKTVLHRKGCRPTVINPVIYDHE